MRRNLSHGLLGQDVNCKAYEGHRVCACTWSTVRVLYGLMVRVHRMGGRKEDGSRLLRGSSALLGILDFILYIMGSHEKLSSLKSDMIR